MGASNIGEAIYNYQHALNLFSEQPDLQSLLETLYSRDRLCYELKDSPPISVGYQDQLSHLDHDLKQQANLICETIDLKPIRDSLNPPVDSWWWFPENFLKPHEQDQYDWVWRSSTLVGWTVNLALLTDITSKFVSGGLGFGGAGAIIFPSLLTLVKARGDLTDVGQDSLRGLFTKLGIKSQWREEATTISTWALLLVIFGFWTSLPQISKLYNYLGYRAEESGDISTAEQNFKRAIALDEDNTDAHYNLGNLYEDLRKTDAAKAQYEIAVKADPKSADSSVAFAQNNLARLLILDEDYSNAVVLLRQGLDNLDQTAENEEQQQSLQYSLSKNLGWARYKQGLNNQADNYLQIASSLKPDKAPAYCLQAQNYQVEEREEEAIAAWEKCRDLADPTQPDQDRWLVMAHKALDGSASNTTEESQTQ
ncbi:tetratricopeptide repeat protein [[Leptolyngbya] sp. PCC 7376]|uniref:tetratricopeptide repeat protein n=1 Tax=[Leptolyngbya] sp. PCC 7376 TaxID=111781 RepID=UPI0002FD652E|nr:tetratricopeptide repeat protein [[Leptolyngbya] sp. PCC 7376]